MWLSVSRPTYYIVQLLLTKFYERFKLEHISSESIVNTRGKDLRFCQEVISWIRSRAPISNQSAVDALFIADPPLSVLLLCACICLEMALVIIVTHCLPKLLPSGLNLAFSFEYLISHQTFILSGRKNEALLKNITESHLRLTVFLCGSSQKALDPNLSSTKYYI